MAITIFDLESGTSDRLGGRDQSGLISTIGIDAFYGIGYTGGVTTSDWGGRVDEDLGGEEGAPLRVRRRGSFGVRKGIMGSSDDSGAAFL